MNGSGHLSRGLQVLIAIVIVVAALRYAQDVFIPIALATLMSFLLAPLVGKLQRWRVNRAIATVAAVSVAFAIIGGVLYLVVDQASELARELPTYGKQLRANIQELGIAVRGGVSQTTEAVEQLTKEIQRAAPPPDAPEETGAVPKVQVVEAPPDAIRAARTLFGPFLGPLGTAVLVIVFTIFMLLRLPDLRDRFIRVLGPRHLRETTEALEDAAQRVSRYLLMQTIINGAQGVMVTVGLTAIGLPNAALFGALTLVLRFIPYVGPWVAAGMPILLSVAVFESWAPVLLTIGLFITLELISNLLVEPWLYGSRTGVTPVALLVAAAFWTWLWGPVGLFLAIPLTVCLVVLGKYIPQLEFLHVLLGDEPVLEEHQRLYQRLLARNIEEADALLDEARRDRSLLELCDTVILPAIVMVEADFDRGALEDERRRRILDHLDAWANDEAEAQRQRGSLTPVDASAARRTAVLCVPASNLADAVCSRLLAVLLAEHGIAAETELPEARTRRAPGVIVISALPPEAVIRGRAAARRLSRRFNGSRVLVGLWHARVDDHVVERLASAGASATLTRFADCLGALTEAVLQPSKRGPKATSRPATAPSGTAPAVATSSASHPGRESASQRVT